MSLHHRIWELVTTICLPSGQETAASDEKARNDQEAEISRLTWAVIDGKATVEERRRLAELVACQHEQRHA